MRFSATVHAANHLTDVLIEVDEAATVGQVGGALCRALGVTGTGVWLGTARIDDDAYVAASPLREGVILSLAADPMAAGFAPPTRGWALHVVGGRDAGLVSSLPIGEHVLGRGGVPPFTDRSMSRRHAILRVSESGATLADLGSSNGTTIDGIPVPLDGAEGEQPQPVRPGQLIGVGDSLVEITPATGPDAAIEPGPAGVIDFTRPPRLMPSTRPVRIVVPVRPTARQARKIPLAGVLAPVVMGGAMAVMVHNPEFLLFTVMSPIMAVSNYVSDRRGNNKQAKIDNEKYRSDLEIADAKLAEGLIEETRRRRQEHPDAASVLLTATLPGRRLWERRRRDEDAFVVRVGTRDLPARLQVVLGRSSFGEDAEDNTAREVFQVPVAVPLREIGVLGLAGPAADVRGVVRWLIMQLAVHQGPRDFSLTMLATGSAPAGSGSASSPWGWLRWLPQVRPMDAETAVANLGNDADTINSRVADLAAQVKARKDLNRTGRVERSAYPALVVVIEGARSLRAVPGMAQVLADGPDVGVIAICLETEERLLPEECTATIVVDTDDPAHLTVRRTGEDPVTGVLAEQVSEAVVTAAARAIAPVRDVSNDEEDSTLPDAARLLDVMSLEPPTEDAIRARWQLEGRTTRIAVGYGSDGVFALDLRRDGPHGLIAGTTGSGKSELLQTIIASLAVANRPDAMNFVLIDYKGGSAFKDCVVLPHTVGMVTDLDAHLVERALTSLGAELKRREHQLADADVKDIEDYIDASDRQPGMAPLPRLLIVIDEFASMARELPDFVSGLVNIAQRGRSLGIHLLLATQRPTGVVSPEIRANTNLRISLRVTDAADSTDVLDSAEAARIPKSSPGRGYVRLGAGVLTPFQAGRVGGRRPGVRPTHAPEPFVAELGWGQLGYPPPHPQRSVVADDAELTDLAVLVEKVTAAAVAENLDHQRTPWLPALPDAVVLSDLPAAGAPAGDLPPLPFGIQDLPAQQTQPAAAFDLTRDGHLLAVGSPRSGRSQLLRTVAASAASLSVADVHVYGIDCGNGALLPMTELPHCGAVVARAQTERVVRLMGRLAAELERRQNALADLGFADITEQRRGVPPEQRLPHLLILLDRWEGWTATLGELDGGRLTDVIMTMMREGASVGLHVVMTGDRSLGTGRISSLTENKLAFRLADRNDYSLLGLNQRQLPDEVSPGRAFASDTAIETQVAMVATDPSGQAQAAAIAAIGKLARERDADVPTARRPFRVDILPSRITFAEATALRPAGVPTGWAMVGVGGDELTAVGVDLTASSCFVVAGPGKSGRSTVLSAMATSLLERGTQVILGAPRPGPLRQIAGQAGVLDLVTDPAAALEVWQAALEKAGDEPVVILLDDAEALKESAAGELFRTIIKGAGQPGQALVLGGNADGICTGLSGWQVEAKKSRQGLLLSPQGTSDGDLIGIRLPRSSVGGQVQPGRGLLHLGDGRLLTLATPSL